MACVSQAFIESPVIPRQPQASRLESVIEQAKNVNDLRPRLWVFIY